MARNLHFAKCEDRRVRVMDCQVASGQGVALGGSSVSLPESGKISKGGKMKDGMIRASLVVQ